MLLLSLVMFICVHDGVAVILAFAAHSQSAGQPFTSDCNGPDEASETCDCPVHLLEKIDEPAATSCLKESLSSRHVGLDVATPFSCLFPPTDPPPKA